MWKRVLYWKRLPEDGQKMNYNFTFTYKKKKHSVCVCLQKAFALQPIFQTNKMKIKIREKKIFHRTEIDKRIQQYQHVILFNWNTFFSLYIFTTPPLFLKKPMVAIKANIVFWFVFFFAIQCKNGKKLWQLHIVTAEAVIRKINRSKIGY